jgi:hypothetical protein
MISDKLRAASGGDNITRFLSYNYFSTDNQTTLTHNFGTQTLGPEHPNRILICYVNKFALNTNVLTDMTLTVGGISANLVGGFALPHPASGVAVGVFTLAYPTGTSANMVMTTTGQIVASFGVSMVSFAFRLLDDPFVDGQNGTEQVILAPGVRSYTYSNVIIAPQKGSGTLLFQSGTNITASTFSSNLTFLGANDQRSGEFSSVAYATNLSTADGTYTATTTTAVDGQAVLSFYVNLN